MISRGYYAYDQFDTSAKNKLMICFHSYLRSKRTQPRKNHFSVYAQQYVKTEIISLHLQKIIINPNFLVIRFTFLYGTKPRKSMTGLKRVICRLIKRSNIRGKTYSDHYMSVIITENKTQKQHCYILVAMETKVGKVI